VAIIAKDFIVQQGAGIAVIAGIAGIAVIAVIAAIGRANLPRRYGGTENCPKARFHREGAKNLPNC
jgi:hypothetical protein